MTENRATFSFSKDSFEISGSEYFVSQQLEFFREAIRNSLSNTTTPSPAINLLTTSKNDLEGRDEPEQSQEDEGPRFPRVLDVVNGKLKITKKVPGKNISDRAVNTSLVYLWGKSVLLDGDLTDAKELREICQDQSCLDSNNFAGTLSARKDLIIVDGTKGSSRKVYKLSFDGKEKALELLASMNAAT